jgi:hypothetical protein
MAGRSEDGGRKLQKEVCKVGEEVKKKFQQPRS